MKSFAIFAATALVATAALSAASVQAVPESTMEKCGLNRPGPSVVKIDLDVTSSSVNLHKSVPLPFTPNRDMPDVI
jgi:hypothetical protein